MQKIVNIRSSQFGLKEGLERFAAKGWRVVNVSKGSELTRLAFSLRWTLILENDSDDANVEELYRIADSITGESWKCQLLILVGILLGSGIVCMLVLLPTLWHH